MAGRRRLDAELVRRGLAESREQAQRDIAEGRVLVSGSLASKAAHQVSDAEPIELVGPPPRFVGRGGLKLLGAIEGFDLAPVFDGARVLDAGSSTGGFTDCALQHGAASVVAVDVGHNQLHERLRADRRVEVHERTNLRTADPSTFGPPADVVVADLSFISLRLVLAPIAAAARSGAVFVLLVKPQFEAGRSEAARGRGVVSDPLVWRRVLDEVSGTLDDLDAAIMGAMVSPITGSDGNVEFVLVGRFGSTEPIGQFAALDVAARALALDAVVDVVSAEVD